MSFPSITSRSLLLTPMALPPARGSGSQSQKLANAVPAATTNGALPAALVQSLEALGALTGVGEAPFTSSFQSALQANAALSALLKAPGLSNGSQVPSAQDPTSLTPLLLQALNAEDLPNASGEFPFISPYQLGLQAIQALTPQVQPSQANLALTNAAQQDAAPIQNSTASTSPDLLQTLNPLNTFPGTIAPLTLGVADPTSSALFQSHLGALAANPLLASASLSSRLAETPTTLRVMATYAGAATSAFSEGQPLNPNSYVLNSTARERLSPNPSPSAMSVEGVAALYNPQGVPVAYRPRIGAFFDWNG